MGKCCLASIVPFKQVYTTPNPQEVPPFVFWGGYLLAADPIDFLVLLFPPNICAALGVEQAKATAKPPPWKSCQSDEYKKATRLTDFRPENVSLAAFKLFTSSLCKLLSSQFSDLAI